MASSQPTDPPVDDDTQLAHTYFDEGKARYAREDFLHALAAFEEAHRLRALPALDYDIARCNERLGRLRAALDSYQHYLDTVAAADNLDEVRTRMSELRTRLAADRRRYVAPAILAGGVIALGAVSAGLVGSVGPSLHELAATWRSSPTLAIQDQAHALQQRATAGYVLFGIAGALATVDLGLWIFAARHRAAR